MITQLVPETSFGLDEIWLDGEAYRHLFRARRLAVGDEVRVADGRGRARWGQVLEIRRDCGRLRLGGPAPSNEPELDLQLLAPTLRPQRASWMVEKASELGVTAIRFLHTERAPRSFGKGTLERLRRVAAAAVEQCHRSRLPETTGVHEWRHLESLLDGMRDVRFLDPECPVERPRALRSPAALLVGPEGGWTEAERHQLVERGGQPVGLGARILRTETAAVVGAALFLVAAR